MSSYTNTKTERNTNKSKENEELISKNRNSSPLNRHLEDKKPLKIRNTLKQFKILKKTLEEEYEQKARNIYIQKNGNDTAFESKIKFHQSNAFASKALRKQKTSNIIGKIVNKLGKTTKHKKDREFAVAY